MGVTLRRGTRLVIASHNEGKVREIADLLAPFGVEAVSAGKLGLPEPEETGDSFAENAALKAVAAARASGLPALADDSGLEVKALGGEPGIHSARWGGAARDFGLAMERVHRELDAAGAKDSTANFTCALALASPDGKVGGVRRQGVRHAHLAATRRPAVSAMIRSSCRKAINRHSGRWSRA